MNPNRHITRLRHPKIYAYTTPQYAQTPWQDGDGVGLVKVGYTEQDDAETRIRQQFPITLPDQNPYD